MIAISFELNPLSAPLSFLSSSDDGDEDEDETWNVGVVIKSSLSITVFKPQNEEPVKLSVTITFKESDEPDPSWIKAFLQSGSITPL